MAINPFRYIPLLLAAIAGACVSAGDKPEIPYPTRWGALAAVSACGELEGQYMFRGDAVGGNVYAPHLLMAFDAVLEGDHEPLSVAFTFTEAKGVIISENDRSMAKFENASCGAGVLRFEKSNEGYSDATVSVVKHVAEVRKAADGSLVIRVLRSDERKSLGMTYHNERTTYWLRFRAAVPLRSPRAPQ